MLSLLSLRREQSEQQSALLDEIWTHFRKEAVWPDAWEFHTNRKAMVRAALKSSNGSIVFEVRDSQCGSRYQLTLLGILLTSKGNDLQQLLANYFEALRRRYQNRDTRRPVTSAEIQVEMVLDDDTTKVLGQLISIGIVYTGSISHDTNWSSTRWQSDFFRGIEDFPPEGSLLGEVDRLALRNYNPQTSVLLEDREMIAASGGSLVGEADEASAPLFVAGLITIMFTDIVKSTDIIQKLATTELERARIWQESFKSKHDEVVLRSSSEFSGVKQNTAGDGFLITFAHPSLAITCAEKIHNEIGALKLLTPLPGNPPLQVRIGVHVGPASSNSEGPAYHQASRICGAAGPRETFISEEVYTFVKAEFPKVRFRRLSRELKGIGTKIIFDVIFKSHSESIAAPATEEQSGGSAPLSSDKPIEIKTLEAQNTPTEPASAEQFGKPGSLRNLIGTSFAKEEDPIVRGLLTEVGKIHGFLSSKDVPWDLHQVDAKLGKEVLNNIEQTSKEFWEALGSLVYHDKQGKYDDAVLRSVKCLARILPPLGVSYSDWGANIQYLSLVVSLYVICITAVASQRYGLLKKILQLPLSPRSPYEDSEPIAYCLLNLRKADGVFQTQHPEYPNRRWCDAAGTYIEQLLRHTLKIDDPLWDYRTAFFQGEFVLCLSPLDVTFKSSDVRLVWYPSPGLFLYISDAQPIIRRLLLDDGLKLAEAFKRPFNDILGDFDKTAKNLMSGMCFAHGFAGGSKRLVYPEAT